MKFELDQYARDALTLFIGKLLGYYDIEEQSKQFDELRNSLTEEELEQLTITFEFLDDCFNYKTVNNHQLKNDLPVLKKILRFCNDHDMYDDDWDLIDVAETILNY